MTVDDAVEVIKSSSLGLNAANPDMPDEQPAKKLASHFFGVVAPYPPVTMLTNGRRRTCVFFQRVWQAYLFSIVPGGEGGVGSRL